jgi:hypothetical protein
LLSPNLNQSNLSAFFLPSFQSKCCSPTSFLSSNTNTHNFVPYVNPLHSRFLFQEPSFVSTWPWHNFDWRWLSSGMLQHVGW